MKKVLLAIFALSVFSFAEPRVHDGFYMNFKTGLGYMDLESENSDYSQVDLKSDLASSIAFRIGGSINPHLALVGAVSLSVASGEVKASDSYYSRKTNAMIMNFLVGPGIVFYPVQGGIMDNFFIGATVGLGFCGLDLEKAYLSWNDDENDKSSSNTGTGVGFSLEIGKEWWVGDNWSLGADLAYTLVYGDNVNYEGIGWKSSSIQLRFTITRS